MGRKGWERRRRRRKRRRWGDYNGDGRGVKGGWEWRVWSEGGFEGDEGIDMGRRGKRLSGLER